MHTHGRESGVRGERAARPATRREDRRRDRRRLTLTLALIVAYMGAEAVGGLLSNSLALLADAGHMLSDAAALALSLFAIWIAQRPATPHQSYGLYRAEILAALANGATLVAISAYIVVEALRRISAVPEVQGGFMLAIALGGLVVNLAALWVLKPVSSGSLNVRGAWLHVLSDTLGSVATICAGCLIWGFGWNWTDPVASVLIALLVVRSAWGLLKEAVSVLMESTPKHLEPDRIRQAIIGITGVRAVHDLHVWTITTGMEALSAHAVVDTGAPTEPLLGKIRTVLFDEFRIDHVTIQFEPTECEQCRKNC